MTHPYHGHREQQVAHRRVGSLLKGEPSGSLQHSKGRAFSKLTSKSAAVNDDGIVGSSGPKRYARGGKVKHGGSKTNIAIVVPGAKPAAPGGLPPGGAAPPMPPGGAPPPMAGPGGPGLPPGLPPRARGGKISGGDATETDLNQMSKRAEKNSYARGGKALPTAGRASGVGALQISKIQKRKHGG